eukprot:m.20763 g.20763  ORF g.20763 m.20763 type:complete len:741 (+) comp8199_c1_seq2:208-2430(+)
MATTIYPDDVGDDVALPLPEVESKARELDTRAKSVTDTIGTLLVSLHQKDRGESKIAKQLEQARALVFRMLLDAQFMNKSFQFWLAEQHAAEEELRAFQQHREMTLKRAVRHELTQNQGYIAELEKQVSEQEGVVTQLRDELAAAKSDLLRWQQEAERQNQLRGLAAERLASESRRTDEAQRIQREKTEEASLLNARYRATKSSLEEKLQALTQQERQAAMRILDAQRKLEGVRDLLRQENEAEPIKDLTDELKANIEVLVEKKEDLEPQIKKANALIVEARTKVEADQADQAKERKLLAETAKVQEELLKQIAEEVRDMAAERRTEDALRLEQRDKMKEAQQHVRKLEDEARSVKQETEALLNQQELVAQEQDSRVKQMERMTHQYTKAVDDYARMERLIAHLESQLQETSETGAVDERIVRHESHELREKIADDEEMTSIAESAFANTVVQRKELAERSKTVLAELGAKKHGLELSVAAKKKQVTALLEKQGTVQGSIRSLQAQCKEAQRTFDTNSAARVLKRGDLEAQLTALRDEVTKVEEHLASAPDRHAKAKTERESVKVARADTLRETSKMRERIKECEELLEETRTRIRDTKKDTEHLQSECERVSQETDQDLANHQELIKTTSEKLFATKKQIQRVFAQNKPLAFEYKKALADAMDERVVLQERLQQLVILDFQTRTRVELHQSEQRFHTAKATADAIATATHAAKQSEAELNRLLAVTHQATEVLSTLQRA